MKNSPTPEKLQLEQLAQESMYRFPYHYISEFRGDFRTFLYDPWGICYVSTLEFLLEQLKRTNFNRVLDIGCGDGRFTRELAMTFPLSHVEGIDYSKRAIALAEAMNNNIKFSVRKIGLWHPELLFDAAIVMEVYEHIPPNSAADFVRGVAGVVNNGGTVFVTVPHRNVPVTPHHFRHFDCDTLRQEWGEYFDIVEIFGFEKISWLRNLLLRLMANRFFILRERKVLNVLYAMYKNNLFFVTAESEAQRIFMRATKV